MTRDPTDLARQHGASWAGQLTEDELRKAKAMRATIVDYSWKNKPKPRKPSVSLSLYLCSLIAILVALMIAHAVVQSGIAGGW